MREDNDTSAFSHDVLDLIEHGLLKVRPEERMSHEEVHQRLLQFEERASSDLLYCLPSSKAAQYDNGLDMDQAQGLELLVQPLFNHEQLRPLYQLFKSRDEDGSLTARLSDFFEVYGMELQQEAVAAGQTAASMFVRKRARQIALEIIARLGLADASNKPSTSPPLGTRTKEQNVTDSLPSGETAPTGLSTAVVGRAAGPRPPDSTLSSWSHGRFSGDDGYENKDTSPRLDLHSTTHIDLEEVRRFLVSPEAFERLKAQLEHWVIFPEGGEADKQRATEGVTERYRRVDRKGGRKKEESGDGGEEAKVDTEVGMGVMTEEEKEEFGASEMEESWGQVSDIESTGTRSQTVSTLLSLFQRGLVLVGLREPPLEEGYQRVHWKNVCPLILLFISDHDY